MTIYRSKRDGGLYTLSIYSPRMYTGKWLESKPLHGNHSWSNVPQYKTKDFVAVAHT